MSVLNQTSIQRAFPSEDWPKRDYSKIDTIVVHRNTIGHDAQSVADYYEQNPEWVGPRMPYHFVIQRDGTIEQALELDVIGYHAKGRNTRSIGVGIVGDFRKHEPTSAQVESILWLLTVLDRFIGGVRIRRHRSWGRYACPGKHLDVEHIAQRVAFARESERTIQLAQEGIHL